MNALVDVDVFTPPDFEGGDASMAKEWVKKAKKYDLEDFWRLLPKQIRRATLKLYQLPGAAHPRITRAARGGSCRKRRLPANWRGRRRGACGP
jgi:hypothetical protein